MAGEFFEDHSVAGCGAVAAEGGGHRAGDDDGAVEAAVADERAEADDGEKAFQRAQDEADPGPGLRGRAGRRPVKEWEPLHV